MQVLITSPEKDEFTRYFRVWTKRLIKQIEQHCLIYHLDKGQANRKRLSGMLEKKSIDLVLINGHGSDNLVEGQEDVVLDKDNVALLQGKDVHVMSCSSAAVLGPLAIKSGTKSYVGYDAHFFAVLSRDNTVTPEKDDTAALFLDPAFTAQKALAIGKNPNEAVATAKKEYNRSIVKALKSSVQSDNDQFIALLKFDRDHLVSCSA